MNNEKTVTRTRSTTAGLSLALALAGLGMIHAGQGRASGPDPIETREQLMTLAVQWGAVRVFPISLDPDGSQIHGVIFDHVRLVALLARKAAAAGTPLNPKSLPGEVAAPALVVMAFPATCGDRTIAPQSVAMTDARGVEPPIRSGADAPAAALVPGFTPPAGAIAVVYNTATLIDGAIGSVRYAEGCAGAPAELKFPVKSERGRVLRTVAGVIPPGLTIVAGTQVRVQVILDFDGTPLYPAYVSGPKELAVAALEAAKQWRIEPSKMNGSPMLTTSTFGVTFR
jgi:hypothetical protein